MIGYTLLISGFLVACLGYPAWMLAWRAGYAVLSVIAGAAMAFIGAGLILGRWL